MSASCFAVRVQRALLRQLHRPVIALALLLAGPAPTWAQFEAANQALGRGDYNGMRAACEPEPHRQTPGCEFILGTLHRYGLGGLPKDFNKAFELLRQGADRGSAGAMTNLAHMYRRGEGMPADQVRAMALYQSAVKAGSFHALSWIGVMHLEGLGVPVDAAEACRWFGAGAAKNDPWGQARFATCWRDGLGGLKKDAPEAMRLASLSAEKGNALGNQIVGSMLRYGEGVKANPTEAAKFFRAALKPSLNVPSSVEPHREAAYQLGLMMLSGTGVEKDGKAAEKMLLTSAQLGLPKAMAQLGNLYRLGGPDVPRDGQKALEWYNAALAIEPVDTALHGLARLYQTGQGVPADAMKARQLYEQALPLGVSDSKLHLAFLLDGGLGGPADRGRAIRLLKEAMASKSLHPDNRKSGEGWLARAERGLPFSDAPLSAVAAAPAANAADRTRAGDQAAASVPSTPPRANREPPSASTPTTTAAVNPTAPGTGDSKAGPSPAEMAEQLARLQQQMAALQKAQQGASSAAVTAQPSAVATPKPPAPLVYANRRALVIGNDRYAHVAPLQNAVADARAIARQLQDFGYRVALHTDLTEKGFKQALRDFRLQIEGGDEVLFFFAGHGVQLASANFLLPVDVKGDNEEQVKDEAIQLQRVLDDLQDRKVKFALAIIDACRDNPFKGSGRAIGGRGLAPTTAATGQMIMFSAGSGQQALDKLGQADRNPNGLFTRIFLQEMTKGGQPVDRVLRNVRAEVVRLARSIGHEQTPALYDQAVGEFFFKQ
jgi:TPR repeat protein